MDYPWIIYEQYISILYIIGLYIYEHLPILGLFDVDISKKWIHPGDRGSAAEAQRGETLREVRHARSTRAGGAWSA